MIDGYWSSLSKKNFDLCFAIDDHQDRFSGFVLTIEQSQEYLGELQRKTNQCPQWIYEQYSARIQMFIDLTLQREQIFHLSIKLMKILVDQLRKRGIDLI